MPDENEDFKSEFEDCKSDDSNSEIDDTNVISHKIAKSFNILKHSTASVKFKLKHVLFNEQDIITEINDKAGIKTQSKHAIIVKVGCNFGEKILDTSIKALVNPTTTRTRKKVELSKSKRKVNGTGKYFNSQLTLFVKLDMKPFKVYMDIKKRKVDYGIYTIDKNDENSEHEYRLLSCIYKVKIFRNGKGQIPGLKTESPEEINRILVPVTNLFTRLMNKKRNDEKKKIVKAYDFYRFIQNYKTFILNDCHYEITKLKQYFLRMDKGPYPKKIFRVKHSSHSKLLVYFNTPIKDDPTKTTNLTIYRKGSVNIDGAVNRKSADKILIYFEKILSNNHEFLFDPTSIPTPEETDSEEEIEDDEVSSSTDSSWGSD